MFRSALLAPSTPVDYEGFVTIADHVKATYDTQFPIE